MISHLLETLQQLERQWDSIFPSKFKLNDQSIAESHAFEVLQWTEGAISFCEFVEKFDTLETLEQIEREWGSFRAFKRENLPSNESHFFQTLLQIEKKCRSFRDFEIQRPTMDELKFLLRDLKLGGIILNLQSFVKERPVVIMYVKILFREVADHLEMFEIRPWNRHLPDVRYEISFAKRRIRSSFSNKDDTVTKRKFNDPSSELLRNYDGTVTPNSVIEFIDTVIENLSDLQEFADPSSELCVGGLRASEELKFLRSFVCFVSYRCIEPHVQLTFFTHVLEVAYRSTVFAWLYFPTFKNGELILVPDKKNPSFSDLVGSKIQPSEPSISMIYGDVLQALKLEQSIGVDYEVRFLEMPISPGSIETRENLPEMLKFVRAKLTSLGIHLGKIYSLLHHLEEIPVSPDYMETRENLQQMLKFLRAKLTSLPTQTLEFHLENINSMIVDAGVLVYSLNAKKKDKEETTVGETNQVVNFSGEIQRMQAMIYRIIGKTFLLKLNSSIIDRVSYADLFSDDWAECLRHYSNSIDSIKNQLQKIHKDLKSLQAIVEQDDGLHHFATQAVGLVYEVEYILDPCNTKGVPDRYLCLRMLVIAEGIRVLMAEVAEIQEKTAFNLVSHSTKDAAGAHNSPQFARNLGMNEEMLARTDEMDELREKLIGGYPDLDVISIVGMPGVGKTTLENKLYFDQLVVSHFEIRAQCCVSQEYTRKGMILTLLRDIIGETGNLDQEDENVLADQLRKKLFVTRYLILIDDIWDSSALCDLNVCFQNAKKGSRIILTTRHLDVANQAKHASMPHDLRLLNKDESWMLLQNKVFNTESCPLFLEDIGKRIAVKCGGLPLSIVLVAGILARMKKAEDYWEQVATNLGPNIQARSEDTMDLSYQNLPHHLRPCFLYFAAFSEDKEIQVSKLAWLWISEGFVTSHTEKPLEDIAKDYLENLVRRSLVIVAKKSSDGKIKTCRIHDLLLEFCRKKAKLENFLERIKRDEGFDPSHVFPPRRLSLYSRSDSLANWCLSFSHVRSFQFREARNIACSHASDTFKRFRFLRVLDLEFTIIDFLPHELALLRYLAFRTRKVTLLLPVNLGNLETLIVHGMGGRVSISDTIWKLAKLRHLHIYDQASFTLDGGRESSKSPSTMDDLQTISSACFSCVDIADKVLAKTPNLRKLRCEVGKFDGSFPYFSNLAKLEMLKISSGPTLTWIKQLKLPSNLKKLTLSNFGINLTEVATHSNLEVLKLLGVTISPNEGEVSSEVCQVSDEQFPKLTILKLENPSFSKWDVSEDAFPCLEHLVLKRCQKLKEIPSCFMDASSLKSVEIISCNAKLADSAKAVSKNLFEMSVGTSGFKVFIRK